MPNRVPWTEREFRFESPADVYPELIERLRGGPLRATDYVRGASSADLVRRDGHRWSIQENIAHLADTDEALFIPRLDQFEQGAEVLVAADMTNQATWKADHNERSIVDVLDRFSRVRNGIVDRLEDYPPDFFARSSRHPRLDQPMRVVDLLLFKAEHDDYHFARVRELIRMLRS